MNDMSVRHFDQARRLVLEELERFIKEAQIQRAVLSPDIFARIRVIFFTETTELSSGQIESIEKRLTAAAGPFWGGQWIASNLTAPTDLEMLNALWDEGEPLNRVDKIRVNERHRSLSVWLHHPVQPPWQADEDGSPIISFYGFKGGVGRTTALAIFAAQRAHWGERVVVIDLDLGAPGASALLKLDVSAEWGVVDYWLEQPIIGETLDLRDYYYRISDPAVIGAGEILVVPAGQFDNLYLLKLARLDYTPPSEGKHPLEALLLQIRADLRPDWILLDARAGLSEAAGFALGGLAHLNVLFGGPSDSNWQGLRLAVRRLGAERARRNLPQDECIVVYGLAPANPQTAKLAEAEFLQRAETTFEQEYYLVDPDDPDDDRFWYIRDMGSRDAPHVPVTLHYSETVAFFTDLKNLVEYGLTNKDYLSLGERIVARFPRMG